MRRIVPFWVLAFVIPQAVIAQATGQVAGRVGAEGGRPLPDVTVTLDGTRLGAITGSEGRFVIASVPAGRYLVRVRRIGYGPDSQSVTVALGQSATADFSLTPQAVLLEQVVSIGYGSTTRRDLTGSVAVVSAEEFQTKAAPTVTLSAGLQGKAPGVQVVSNSGLPGGGLRVRVRGTGSITANSEPLYVIDGLPAEQGSGSSNPQANPLISIDPNDVESIEILKDASATAIYGARGANGVVLITTRRGARGGSRVTVDASYGVQQISKTIPVLTGPQFMQLSNEARANAARTLLYTPAQIAAAQTFDYPDMLLRNAPQASTAMSISGGDERARYLLSGNYAKQAGIEIGSNFERYGGRLNVDADASRRFRAGTNLSMSRAVRNAPAVENGSLGNSANGIQAAMQFAPYQAPRDAAGLWVKQSPSTEPVPNPLANAYELKDLNTFARLLGSVYGEYDLTSALRLRSTAGGNFQFDDINYFAPRTILAGGTGGQGFINSSESRDLTSETQLTYRRETLGPGSFDVLGGFSVQKFYNTSVTGNGGNFPTDATTIFNLGSGSQLSPAGSSVTESALLSYLGRANYNIADKYFMTLNARYDGSSRFGANNKWAFFPSAALAWRISDESFMKRMPVFSDLKLRLSFGTAGSQAIAPYQSLSSLGIAWYSFGTTEVPALAPSSTMPNPNLRWEQKSELNAGFDAGFMRNRITLTLDAYRSKTRDLLLSVAVPSTTGFSSQLRNIGSVQNTGLELSLNTVNIERERFTWRSGVNVAGNRNKIVNLGTTLNSRGERVDLKEILYSARGVGGFFSPSETHIVRIGEPLGSIYGYRVIGLWQQGEQCYLTTTVDCTPGEYKIADVSGPNGVPDGLITAADRVILGHADPKLYGGFGNTLTFGSLSLDAFLNFVYGNKIINAGNAYGSLVIGQANERTTVLDRWTPTHTNTMVPRANNTRPRRLYSTLVEDGSYLRLQTLTLGYELPKRFIARAQTTRLFLTAQNLFVITNYSGFDPDVNSSGGDARLGGADVGAYPRSRTWNLGASVVY
jgi:TonB-linked SusC/RagA family outer membrane protein